MEIIPICMSLHIAYLQALATSDFSPTVQPRCEEAPSLYTNFHDSVCDLSDSSGVTCLEIFCIYCNVYCVCCFVKFAGIWACREHLSIETSTHTATHLMVMMTCKELSSQTH